MEALWLCMTDTVCVQQLMWVRVVLQLLVAFDDLPCEACVFSSCTRLQQIDTCHPAVFVGGLAALEILKTRNRNVTSRPVAVAGLASGEITALVAAGVLSFEDGLTLVKCRAEALTAAAGTSQQSMLTLAGFRLEKVLEFCNTVKADGEICELAVALFPKGFTLAGTQVFRW